MLEIMDWSRDEEVESIVSACFFQCQFHSKKAGK